MYIDLYELPLQLGGRRFFVQFETEEQHYRIEFIDSSTKPMLIAKNDEWYDLADRSHALAIQIGKFIEETLTEPERKYSEKDSAK
jgi:hypothetical protein